jgi:hypothetical protein
LIVAVLRSAEEVRAFGRRAGTPPPRDRSP